jgi:hypothetical protein
MLDGKPYQRRLDVEAEIAAALARSPREWPTLIESQAGISNEALVFLAKRAAKIDRDLCGRLIHELSGRLVKIATRWAQGFDPMTMDEIVLNVEIQIVELVLTETPSRRSDFLEVAFGTAVERRTINAVEKWKKSPEARRETSRNISDDDTDSENDMELIADTGAGPEEILARLDDERHRTELIRRARAAVKDTRHVEAVILRYVHGWPITDKDPTKPSLERHFEKSGRQIQNWIKSALKMMRIAIGEHS